eukprot:TRINITY_DN10040_c0_g3_i1.p1 TRINITY_DN10040_c0_g3~~TRINITY_DN10040_c0_g3_i1.p1  ORF type:complete len:826 (-),score=128.87 TRINITY_DN10040_c0_g3_i1:376-2853(-)
MLRGTVVLATGIYSMVRTRQRKAEAERQGNGEPRRSYSSKKKEDPNPSSGKLYLFAGLGCIIGVLYFVYQGYLETRVNTPLNYPRAVREHGLDIPERYWGSYRPGLYFGMKTRAAKDVNTGLMWFLPQHIQQHGLGLRHWCEQGDNLKQFGWNKHDGVNFGIQNILDRSVNITTSFVKTPGGKFGGDWSNRIEVKPIKKKDSGENMEVGLLYYAALEDGAGDARLTPVYADDGSLAEIRGTSSGLGSWRLWWKASKGEVTSAHHLVTLVPGLETLTDTVLTSLRLFNGRIVGLDSGRSMHTNKPNFIVFQLNMKGPTMLDIVFESDSNLNREESLVDYHYTRALNEWIAKFDIRFEQTFHLGGKSFNETAVRFAQSAMSNMIGGIGYFYGASAVKSRYNRSPVPYWDAPLYTGVPSRSFFPRGFLWDEGFHNLLISKWDKDISADILAHWLDLLNSEGWIPREQILGKEARAKVPAEFVVQENRNANPPTLLLTLHSIVHDIHDGMTDWWTGYLSRMWPRLVTWYNWFNTTQVGELRGTYRWRGRNGTAIRELNPKTLTSGLDDYPRASHPTRDERHLDLRCWMALASRLMADIGQLLGRTDYKKFESTARFLYNNDYLEHRHWSQSHKAFLDWGLHTDDVSLQRPKPVPGTHPSQVSKEKVRVMVSDPQLGFVNSYGYVSLFPFLLQILEPENPKLEIILTDLLNPDLLFTPFGLRSLALTAPLYMKRNTEHDPPYWRGPIWINLNYLTIRAAHGYANREGPYKAQAQKVYSILREAVINNVMKEYYRTGYVWEQYNDRTGEGQGCKPFTGWSALTVLLMGETY